MQDAQSDERRRYEIVQTLGKGGFGTVYRARLIGEGGFTKDVALKVLNEDMQAIPEIGSRLRDEGRILGFIRHRAVVQVDGLVKLEGNWTVVMEYIEGCDLFDLVSAGRIPTGSALEIAGEVAGAMHAAYHAMGPSGQPLKLIHRDIKPGNVQVTALGEVKLLDFGVARADFEGREAKTRSMRFGSMGYLSPERLDGEDGPGGDIYALGIVLYEILTGERFGQTALKRAKHDTQIATKLERVKLAVGPRGDGVVALVGQMLSYDPAARPTFREIEDRCQDLRVTVGGERLRDWSEKIIPALRNRKKQKEEDDGRTGSILVEGSTALPKAANLVQDATFRAPIDDAKKSKSNAGAAAPTRAPGASGSMFPWLVVFGVAIVILVLALVFSLAVVILGGALAFLVS